MATWAHPRSRGENAFAAYLPIKLCGSSPLTRGKQAAEICFQLLKGLIPAHAGKTCPPRSGVCWGRAHPRSRGENLATTDLTEFQMGSSPLTRGKQPPPTWIHDGGGLIPAHAGQTIAMTVSRRPPPAHPRSRGENAASSWGWPRPPGSSPLTRGKRRVRGLRVPRGGLIPAHAGKTICNVAPPGTHPAHPRSRGENIRPIGLASMAAGSSPLTRGKRSGAFGRARSCRLIPAHAGKTEAERKRYSDDGAHPRSRGENTS